MTLLPGKM